MDIFATVKTRLSAIGYIASKEDKDAVIYNINKAEATLKAKVNRSVLPEGLFYTWADMAAGMFLRDKKTAGALADIYDFTAPAKSISEGDTSVTFAIADNGSYEDQFDAMLEKMIHPDEEIIIAYRRLVW